MLASCTSLHWKGQLQPVVWGVWRRYQLAVQHDGWYLSGCLTYFADVPWLLLLLLLGRCRMRTSS
jgi:hypothetical protein